jgi:hypothetical protein
MKNVATVAETHAAKAIQAMKHQALAKDVSELLDADPLYTTKKYVEAIPKNKLCDTAYDLTQQITLSAFALGGTLSRIQTEKVYRQAGFKSFFAFTEDRLGLKTSSVGSYMRLYGSLTAHGVDYERVKVIKWSVLREVAEYLDPAKLDVQVPHYASLTVDEVKAEVKGLKDPVKAKNGALGVVAKSAKNVVKGNTPAKTYDTANVQAATPHVGHAIPAQPDAQAAAGQSEADSAGLLQLNGVAVPSNVTQYLWALGAGDALALLRGLFGGDQVSVAACTQLDLVPAVTLPVIKPGKKAIKAKAASA